MSRVEDQKKIALLQEYVQCLQKQNFAKNSETTLIYQQLASLQQQNQMLKSIIDTTKSKWQQQKEQLTQKLYQKQTQQIIQSRNYGDQLRNSVDIGSLKLVAEDMRVQLETREAEIQRLSQEKLHLQEELHGLRQQLSQATSKAVKSEQKLRNQMQVVKQLQNQIFGLRNSRVETKSNVSFAKLESDKLVRQNNELIQKIRVLQKQKNGYYNELKMTSPLKSRPSNTQQSKSALKRSQHPLNVSNIQNAPNTNSACGQGKSDRWNLMEEKLRAIRNQNEQLRANLAIH